jgi:hypothetical protein
MIVPSSSTPYNSQGAIPREAWKRVERKDAPGKGVAIELRIYMVDDDPAVSGTPRDPSIWADIEDVPLVVELRDDDPVSELSQAGEAATSGAAVATVV